MAHTFYNDYLYKKLKPKSDGKSLKKICYHARIYLNKYLF